MARYQLFRTSPYLTGQVMVDVLVNKNPDTQKIWGDEIHLSPIDPNIIYNESDKRPMMRYSHGENVKDLYSQISSQFYTANGEYSDHIWIYDVNGWPVDPFSHTYMMGPRRMRFDRYKKQFSYFMPIWISEYTDFSKLRFIVHASGLSDKDVIINSFSLNPEICEYFQNYMDNTASGTPISDNLLNIDLENKTSYIQGLEVTTGRYNTRDTSYVVNFLLKRERPMIETDYNIVDLFRQNCMVAQQILNFNFVFNLRDISGAWPEYYIYGKKIRFWIEAKYDGEVLPLKDLYTNYTFVPRYDLLSMASSSVNCLDFLEDYHCKDMVMNNKFTQPTFHWALKDDPKYMFNLYSGCSPLIGEDTDTGEKMFMDGGSFNWVDVSLTDADSWRQNWKWAFFNKASGPYWRTPYIDAMNEAEHGDWKKFNNLFTPISINKESIHIGSNIFYRYINDEDKTRYEGLEDLDSKKFYITIVMDPNLDDSQSPYDFSLSREFNNNICIVLVVKNIETAILYNLCHFEYIDDTMTYKSGLEFYDGEINESMIQLLQYLTGTLLDPDIKNPTSIDKSGKTLWGRWKRPMKVVFTEGLDAIRLGTNVLGTIASEIVYADSENYYSYMYRYSGKMIPFFTDVSFKDDGDPYKNFIYRYFQWSDSDTDIIKKYSRLLKQKIDLEYPSVMFNNEVGCTPWIEHKSDQDVLSFYNDWPEDVIWNRRNLMWNLPPTVMFTIELPKNISDHDREEAIWTGFKNAILDMNNSLDHPLIDTIHANDSRMRSYIEKLYKREQQFEYKAIDDINHIIYTITYKLR